MYKLLKYSMFIFILTFNFSCVKSPTIDFTNSKTFFNSFNKSREFPKVNQNTIKDKEVKDLNEKIKFTDEPSKKKIKKTEVNLSLFEKKLKSKIGSSISC